MIVHELTGTQQNSEQVREFAKRILTNSGIRTDALHVFRVLGETHRHQKVTPPEQVEKWLPKVPTSRAF